MELAKIILEIETTHLWLKEFPFKIHSGKSAYFQQLLFPKWIQSLVPTYSDVWSTQVATVFKVEEKEGMSGFYKAY